MYETVNYRSCCLHTSLYKAMNYSWLLGQKTMFLSLVHTWPAGSILTKISLMFHVCISNMHHTYIYMCNVHAYKHLYTYIIIYANSLRACLRNCQVGGGGGIFELLVARPPYELNSCPYVVLFLRRVLEFENQTTKKETKSMEQLNCYFW